LKVDKLYLLPTAGEFKDGARPLTDDIVLFTRHLWQPCHLFGEILHPGRCISNVDIRWPFSFVLIMYLAV